MCGIAGAAWTNSRQAISADTVKSMTDVLRHRGPDDQGSFHSDVQVQPPYRTVPGVALGHTRLSIIDVTASRQPLANEDGTVQVVFNGEIYNYRELRARLEASGHTFRTTGDTEVLVHLYEDEGLGFLDHLVGMFALAIWDANHRRVVLARDRLGQKPLLYRWVPDQLLFASELKSFQRVPGLDRQVDPSALDEFLLYQYVPHPNTIFRGIRKLPPGHYLEFVAGQIRVKPYWQPDFNREVPRTDIDYVAQLRELLSESVRLRMRSDVPLGAFLSGGADSSTLVALMQQHASQPVKTFSVGFPAAEYDETKYARQVAHHLGTEHHELNVNPNSLDVLSELIWHYDEPFGDSSAIPTFHLCRQTRAHVKVAISGDGGDELFLGYERYQALRWAGWFDRLPRPFRQLLAPALWQRLPAPGRQKSLRRRFKRLCAVLETPAARRYADLIGIFNEHRRANLYHDDFLSELSDSDPVDWLSSSLARANQRDVTTAASLADLVTYLPCDLCFKVDMASMAHGLECRQPLLDHRVVELAIQMPATLKLRGRRGKQILRDVFGEQLPGAVFRRRKMGFGVPLDHWLRGELKEMAHDTLLSRRAIERGYFREAAVRSLLEQHIDNTFDHSARLWSLLVLELWHREWVDS